MDDDEMVLQLQSFLLARAGYDVDTAVDGEQGWEALQTRQYDLVVTDHNMPRLCGLDLVARVRNAGMSLPVIIHSGSVNLEALECRRLNPTLIIRKSADLYELLSAVERILPRPAHSGRGHIRNLPPQPPNNILSVPFAMAGINARITEMADYP